MSKLINKVDKIACFYGIKWDNAIKKFTKRHARSWSKAGQITQDMTGLKNKKLGKTLPKYKKHVPFSCEETY